MKPEEPIAFDVWASQPSLTQAVRTRLQDQGYRYDPLAAIKLVIDVPSGFALRTLEQHKEPAELRLIVVTYSLCPEYWEDLWDLQPLGLLVDGTYEHDYSAALHAVARGERYRRTPEKPTRLTPTERAILRYTARGWSSKRIAARLHLRDQTV